MAMLPVRLIRSSVAHALVGLAFARMSFAIPVHRLRETATLLAFHHPRPAYPVHILLVPKKALASLAALTSAEADFMVDLFSSVRSLVAEFQLDKAGYRLLANGGEYQDFPQLHFHLVSGSAASRPADPAQ
jgi:histidine triad (HIT) family protein